MSVLGRSRAAATGRASTRPPASASGASSAASARLRASTSAWAWDSGFIDQNASHNVPKHESPEPSAGALSVLRPAPDERAQGSADRGVVVPKRGLEPPRGCPHQTLNLACLPIPPLRRTPERGADVLEATWQVKAIPGLASTCRDRCRIHQG